jgi:chaperone required for assembly of F1-ATPase
MKRFYEVAGTKVLEDGVGVSVELDGRPVRTPAKHILALPNVELAEVIANEWAAQGEEVKPDSMPFMRLACTAHDHVRDTLAERAAEAARYAETDLVCYRVEQPSGLVARQRETWDPLLKWMEEQYSCRFEVTDTTLAIAQPPETLARIRAVVDEHDEWTLTALLNVVRPAGSLVIGLALMEQRLSVEEAWAASQIEETWQIEHWGEDEEATERRDGLRAELVNAARLFGLLRN